MGSRQASGKRRPRRGSARSKRGRGPQVGSDRRRVLTPATANVVDPEPPSPPLRSAAPERSAAGDPVLARLLLPSDREWVRGVIHLVMASCLPLMLILLALVAILVAVGAMTGWAGAIGFGGLLAAGGTGIAGRKLWLRWSRRSQGDAEESTDNGEPPT